MVRIRQIGFDIKLSKKAIDYLAEKGFDSNFGARPLNRAIQKYLEDPLAEEILKSDVKEGDLIAVDLDVKKDELTFKKQKTKAKKEPKEENEA
jgi:ATP-dependent Clp protease ATP-binding subunit ClpC